MSSVEIFVVVVGVIAGYLIISQLLGAKPKARAADSEPGKGPIPEKPQERTFDSQPGPWETVLEIPRSATVEEIRRAYRTQMSKYHPDKVASLGKEFKPIAERRSKEINAAYADAMKSKGVAP